MPYRDQFELDDEMRTALAKRRATHLRAELDGVMHLARLLSAQQSATTAAARRERADVIDATDSFAVWWFANLNTSALSPAPRVPDPLAIKHARVELAEAQAKATLARELAAIAKDRIATLRDRIVANDDDAAQPHDATLPDRIVANDDDAAQPHDATLPDDVVARAVEAACVRDTRDLVDSLRRAMSEADNAASHAQRDAIRAALEGRDAEQEATSSTFGHALNALSHAQLYLELLRLSLLPVFGAESRAVARLTSIATELGTTATVPNEAWRRRVASTRDELEAVIGSSIAISGIATIAARS